jgi:hypothetical protein
MKSPLRQTVFGIAISLCAWVCVSVHAQTSVPAASSAPAISQSPPEATPASSPSTEISIPGPLRSFMRLAAISQQVSPEEVVPLLARNIFSHGYQGSRQTEFLILLSRYVHQARELQALAGPEGVIHVSNCEGAKPLLGVLGYRVRQNCGQGNTSLVTEDPERAFLTIDSGFPLPDLEETLQGGKPFAYHFVTSRVPVLFTESEWTAASPENDKDAKDLVDTLLRNPHLARLYWGLSRNDTETRVALRKSVGIRKLVPLAAPFDFYGSHICIRSGKVVVPGGRASESAWKDLVGASPESPGEFVPRLLAKDKGWLAAYFDSLSRISRTQQAHFTEPHRLRRCYEALRGRDPSPDAARPVFRPAPGLLLLLTRMQWEPSDEPHIPGNLDAWKQILSQKTESNVLRDASKRGSQLRHSEQLLEVMFALSRVETDVGPLQIYLMLSEMDSRRPPEKRLSPQTVILLASKFSQFSNHYLVFSEFPDLSDASMTRFLDAADAIDKIPNHTLRGNAMGIFQANVGLWQILARQGQISKTDLNESWQGVLKPFVGIRSSYQLLDAGRISLGALLLAATGKANASQDEIIDLLAGPHQASAEGQRAHQELANRMRSVLDGQRLVSLDTLLALDDGLNELARGKAVGDQLIPLAGELREFEMPRPIFTGSERTQWAAGTYNNRHTELQMKTDLRKVIKSPSSRAQVAEARGELTPFLRDALVGLNYAYYEPPGAQALHNNPLFVRSHDFAGETVSGMKGLWRAPMLFGEGSPAGGGAHLVGSLADLPYVLAEAEQDFIAPENVQALIWRELVPGLLVGATLPRWWSVDRNELHAVALYQRAGEELLTAATGREELRSQVMSILSDRMSPQMSERVGQALLAGNLAEVLPRIMPADTFYLAAEFRRQFPGETDSWGPAGQELESLCQRYPAELSWERLSQDFGVPHPILAQNYARELLNVKPFPAFQGYSSRLLAETWDSSNLYWARLADEVGYSPVMLHRLAPELTRRMVEKIFASELEDWPALLRAMRATGEEFRQGKLALAPTSPSVSQPEGVASVARSLK